MAIGELTQAPKVLVNFRTARKRRVPLVAIRTLDPAATQMMLCEEYGGGTEDQIISIVSWDVVQGFRGLNGAGKSALKDICQGEPPENYTGPVGACAALQEAPEGTIAILHNMHRVITESGVSQAIWNLRDTNKRIVRTTVLLAPELTLPSEIQADVMILDEELPTEGQLAEIVNWLCTENEVPLPDEEGMTKATDALLGLNAFAAEQAVAMSLTAKGLNQSALWERKRQMIDQTRGLTVWRGGETFDDICGSRNVVEHITDIGHGEEPPRAIVFIDEIEKAVGNSQGDTSNVSQDYLATLLTWMQDRNAAGMLFVGAPGSGKSAIAKAAGGSLGIPTLQFDLGGMKDSLVGSSEANIRTALKVVDAVSQGRALFIATCNGIATLPPELRRRFWLGTFYFDLPTDQEGAELWTHYAALYGVEPPTKMPQGWTGAEIKAACLQAYRKRRSVEHAMAFIVPVKSSMKIGLERLRSEAAGAYISASYPETYDPEKQDARSGGRKMDLA